jgi:hypothetical protein
MPQPMVVREPSICSLITQTAPIIFTAPRYPLLIDSEFRALIGFAWGAKRNAKGPRKGNEGLMVYGVGFPLCVSPV